MTAALMPNMGAFMSLLKSPPSQKTAVTGVTAVTAAKPDTYQLQSSVTAVTEGSRAVISDEIIERQAFAEIDGHVPTVFSMAFAAFQISGPEGRTVDQWHAAINDAGCFLNTDDKQAASLDGQCFNRTNEERQQ